MASDESSELIYVELLSVSCIFSPFKLLLCGSGFTKLLNKVRIQFGSSSTTLLLSHAVQVICN